MTVSKDLMLAILAMDSYNRGYDAGISEGDADENGLNDAVGTAIGNAIIKGASDSAADSAEVAAGFYAIAYNTDFGTVVSYRGTDFNGFSVIDPDVVHGWSVGVTAKRCAA